ncbi:MAG: iron-regulated protein [Bacteroidetes bacterium]|nr:MAG: iron-regulated protein [Bacteroidota bacterium]
MKYRTIILISALVVFASFKSDKPAYKLFDSKGKEVKYRKLVEAASNAEVVFFGELHNNPISHWLQLELTTDLLKANPAGLTLGAEMFETDNQLFLNQYLNGSIETDSLKKLARLWPNYKTDIAPLVDFAKENKLKFVASNIPRKYASMVFRKGFEALDTLPDNEKTFIAPLPIAYDPQLPGYVEMVKMMEDMGHGSSTENFPKAQAVKDATMAWFIYKNIEASKVFIHYNGAYHSDNYEGIIWYLKRLIPEIRIVTISSIETDQPVKLPADKKNVADFIIAVPSTMTKTH